ncbi:Dihydrolipoyllysine-residue succinyltransferase component [Coccomyxa sp. Obi]|nr:Dihydrolipoyllysine-residue succinyltransferase component [Coccomyxa sp. Obi]
MAARCLRTLCRASALQMGRSSQQLAGEARYAGIIQAAIAATGDSDRCFLHLRTSDAQPGWHQHSASLRSFHASAIASADVPVAVPSMGDSISEGTVASVEKKQGDVVKEDDILLQIETDKVTIDVRYTGSEAGTVKEILVKEEDTVSVGQEVVIIETGNVPDDASEAPKEEASKTEPEPAKAPEKKAEAAPKPPPTPEKKAEPAKPKPAPSAPSPAAQAEGQSLKPERRVKMTRLRARVAERLKGAQNTYAMLTTFNEIDMTNLMKLRADFKDLFLETHGVKLGFMSAFVKASADALLKVPAVNAVIDGDEIIYRDYTDISIAVATPKGLVVPVLRNVDSLSFAEVEKTINGLGKKAREGTISIDDMAGGTFTISNGGVYGSLLSTPIINPPQSAILGMHSINQRAMVMGKEIVARPIMNVALTYDHRLIDGREAVTFLKRVKDIVEDPRRLLIDV